MRTFSADSWASCFSLYWSWFSIRYSCIYYVVCVTSEITLMVVMSGTACSTLAFDNCVSCTDASPATLKAQCTKCGSGYTLKDDSSSCTSMFYWIFETLNRNLIWQDSSYSRLRAFHMADLLMHIVTVWRHSDGIASWKYVRSYRTF